MLVGKSDLRQHFLGSLTGLRPVDHALGAALFISEENILRDGEVGAQRQLLVDDNDTLRLTVLQVVELTDFAFVDDITRVGSVGPDTGQNIHQCGFSGAVFSAEGVDLSLSHLDVDIVQCLDAGEFLGDVIHFQNILFGHAFTPLLCFIMKNRGGGLLPPPR